MWGDVRVNNYIIGNYAKVSTDQTSTMSQASAVEVQHGNKENAGEQFAGILKMGQQQLLHKPIPHPSTSYHINICFGCRIILGCVL